MEKANAAAGGERGKVPSLRRYERLHHTQDESARPTGRLTERRSRNHIPPIDNDILRNDRTRLRVSAIAALRQDSSFSVDRARVEVRTHARRALSESTNQKLKKRNEESNEKLR